MTEPRTWSDMLTMKANHLEFAAVFVAVPPTMHSRGDVLCSCETLVRLDQALESRQATQRTSVVGSVVQRTRRNGVFL
jgi:hypothetical protein